MASTKVTFDRSQAACKNLPVNMFFPVYPPQASRKTRQALERAAVAVCRTCPVMAQCGEYAIRNRIEDGIWGGVSERERFVRQRSQHAKVCPICGEWFLSIKVNTVYCSAKCNQKAQVARRKVEPTGRCEYCGDALTSARQRSYCSPKCRRNGIALRTRGRIVGETFEMHCRVCGTAFMARTRRTLYCSKRCNKQRVYARRVAAKNALAENQDLPELEDVQDEKESA